MLFRSVSALKKKLSDIKVHVERFDAELAKIDTKFDNIITQTEIYKSKLERELGREVRRLERELALLSKGGAIAQAVDTPETDLKVASTIGIFDAILRQMCSNADDFRLASEAFLFPTVYERVMAGTEEAYYLSEVPNSIALVVKRGQEYVQWIREEIGRAHV